MVQIIKKIQEIRIAVPKKDDESRVAKAQN